MDRASIFRATRFALCIICLLACGLLIALWIWSYHCWHFAAWVYSPERSLAGHSVMGRLVIVDGIPFGGTKSEVNSYAIGPQDANVGVRLPTFYRRRTAYYTVMYFPHWLPVLMTGALAALFSFKRTWQFSLRSLLIATTCIAAILGWAVVTISC